MERNTLWWTKDIIHNVLVHPWLPFADALQCVGIKRFPALVFWLHDVTAPRGGG